MEQRLSLITLGVGDLTTARAFYERLGWRASPPGNDDDAFFQTGGMILGLCSRDALAADAGLPAESSGFRGVALAYSAREKAGVHAVARDGARGGHRHRQTAGGGLQERLFGLFRRSRRAFVGGRLKSRLPDR